tara:strand:+ start:464 stop:1642 length:1179 start_codon:yes stop_codon:yes gene_type:complete
MEKIYDSFENFELNKIRISNPISKAGGYYMLKFTMDGSPLYIQPPKCMTKNGIICNKKSYTDLLFSNDNQEFLSWLENLESYCQNHIFDNREKWFEGDLDIDDIESYFVSPIKFYRSGKSYLVRVNIPTLIGKPSLKIYDESESEVSISSINDKVEINSILEFKGIKCSARSFQIDIEVKQMMKMEPIQLFNKCIIKRNIPQINSSNEEHIDINNDDKSKEDNDIIIDETAKILETNTNIDSDNEDSNENVLNIDTSGSNEIDINNVVEENEINDDDKINEADNESIELEENTSEKTLNNLGVSEEENINSNDSIEEIKLDPSILESSEVIEIKEANEVYYKMYKDAIQRAKVARDLALSSYLEAKNLKNKYMLDEALCDSDDSDLEKELEI